MKSELHSLSRLFTENLLRIPDYQRGYAWTARQLADFWNDIEQLELGKNHYTGVLTLEEVSPDIYRRWDDDLWIINSKSYQPYFIVDGQQRLTTAMIVIQTILERLPDDDACINYTSKRDIKRKFICESRDGGISHSYLFGYEKDNPSYEYLKALVFMERSDNHAISERTIYTRNLADAKSYFSDKVSPLSIEQLEIVYRKVTQHFMFNVYVITEDIDVFVAFETMNNRGKKLSHLELLKNRLIFLSTKLGDPQEERERLRKIINESWKHVYYYLGLNEENPLNDDLFLTQHYILSSPPGFVAKIHSAPLNGDDVPENLDYHIEAYDRLLLEKHFTVKNILLQEDGTPPLLKLSDLYSYATSVSDFSQLYYRVLNPLESKFYRDEIVLLDRINRLGPAKDRSNLLVLAIYLRRKPKADHSTCLAALKNIERILFIDEITLYIRGLKSFPWTHMAVRLMQKSMSIEDVLKELQAYNKLLTDTIDLKQELAYWASKPLGYYKWRGIKYFMFEYEQKLRSLSRDRREKLHWKEFMGEHDDGQHHYATIEHIYPQQVVDVYWKSRFNDYSVRQRNALKGSLGNLLPLSRSKNAALSNKSFPEKRGSENPPTEYAFGCYSENEVAQNAEWTPKHILRRGLRLLTFLEEHWQIPMGDEDDKTKVLGLEFVVAGRR